MLKLKYLLGGKPKQSTNKYEFKVQHTFNKRKIESDRVRQKHPNKIPIIIEKSDNSDVVNIDKNKWLVQQDLTVGQFLLTIRRRIKLDQSEGLFILIDNSYLPSNSETMGEVYEKHKDMDGFLYCSYSKEQCYG